MDNHSKARSVPLPFAELKLLFSSRDDSFWRELERSSQRAETFSEMTVLSSLRKKTLKAGFGPSNSNASPIKVALIGGSTLYPLSDFVEHMLCLAFGGVELMSGDYNNYVSEIHDPSSRLYEFKPNYVIVLPDERSCRYTGKLTDPEELIAAEVERASNELLQLCSIINERSSAEVILCNYVLPSYFDLGAFRSKSLGAEWSFKKAVNLFLGTKAPNYLHVCDLEFFAYRSGGNSVKDERSWFESKQSFSPTFQVTVAKEIAHLILSLKQSPKKVLALDLDNTLWGGVIGDDGMEGIELGDTSPRGEAFKAFQTYILSLTDRGVLLAVCSKNDHENAVEPFQRHPEMVLREEHIVSFKANWEPKAKNLIEMAEELSLGLDSFVFVDDNPAEIEIVRQFAPDVTTILLGPDPSTYVKDLKESRLFEPITITGEDLRRTEQYKVEAERKSLESSAVDMDSYLESLQMEGIFAEFNPVDLPRIAQLINKSNQFNLTTKRRSEAELETMMSDSRNIGFSMRLGDRFGDHGLISVVIGSRDGNGTLEIDTWLMSCRVLKRQVEEQVLNEIARRAREMGCSKLKGVYLPTAKNGMVKDLYPRLGFDGIGEAEDKCEFELLVEPFSSIPTFITIKPRSV